MYTVISISALFNAFKRYYKTYIIIFIMSMIAATGIILSVHDKNTISVTTKANLFYNQDMLDILIQESGFKQIDIQASNTQWSATIKSKDITTDSTRLKEFCSKATKELQQFTSQQIGALPNIAEITAKQSPSNMTHLPNNYLGNTIQKDYYELIHLATHTAIIRNALSTTPQTLLYLAALNLELPTYPEKKMITPTIRKKMIQDSIKFQTRVEQLHTSLDMHTYILNGETSFKIDSMDLRAISMLKLKHAMDYLTHRYENIDSTSSLHIATLSPFSNTTILFAFLLLSFVIYTLYILFLAKIDTKE